MVKQQICVSIIEPQINEKNKDSACLLIIKFMYMYSAKFQYSLNNTSVVTFHLFWAGGYLKCYMYPRYLNHISSTLLYITSLHHNHTGQIYSEYPCRSLVTVWNYEVLYLYENIIFLISHRHKYPINKYHTLIVQLFFT